MRSYIKPMIILIAAACVLLLYFFFDARRGGFPPCPFFKLTGLLCPGCGSQRGLSALLHGDVLEAMHYNLLMVASLPIFFYAGIVYLKTGGKQRPKLIYHPIFPQVLLLVVLCFWVVRNIVTL